MNRISVIEDSGFFGKIFRSKDVENNSSLAFDSELDKIKKSGKTQAEKVEDYCKLALKESAAKRRQNAIKAFSFALKAVPGPLSDSEKIFAGVLKDQKIKNHEELISNCLHLIAGEMAKTNLSVHDMTFISGGSLDKFEFQFILVQELSNAFRFNESLKIAIKMDDGALPQKIKAFTYLASKAEGQSAHILFNKALKLARSCNVNYLKADFEEEIIIQMAESDLFNDALRAALKIEIISNKVSSLCGIAVVMNEKGYAESGEKILNMAKKIVEIVSRSDANLNRLIESAENQIKKQSSS
ncbi:hypothetical protein A2526_02645 [candidate division WOR-1 bacterium RIFOXYD2_FULL_36_8]|uniref:Uncharacterized protein n=1 Tax=candidate division WOR-1 bacterium RIFOXYB2_FULL_36_35 TaxID=1802578 RepID=A0A1F4S4C5_UNCSA|nr:MAG: hypothetical protein A2230_01090 [candidate division WOR-1 bacterium RIFOXYA2_FULL_36_21]OGC14276.1 MAG: hypothetical protein A2282_06805 [candidate division WOR-1 bacterium RIFOXYA12_FULL_36_13]OGC15281.1 MAG: hypothetical protein A2290_03300 [candidate division WOR-1 bacterium RIFOXYB2_FULL_36_35]OGC41114.1 MAG: hypothetical protein A2526_02645 [candidate division WOR-1 bacterium RIFOXYD2_FULL_36_8]